MLKKYISLCLLFVLFAFCLSANEDASVTSSSNYIPDPQLAMSIPDYPITCGDVYKLTFTSGTTPVVYNIPVDTSYTIRIANLGTIKVEGLTFLQLKQQVETLVLRNFPMSGVQFVLSNPAVFIVQLTGEVSDTSERKVWALTRLSSIVNSSNTDYSSFRNVEIESRNGKKNQYDLFKANREGDLTQDPYLRPGDKIILHRAERKVHIEGAVERSGFYELLPGENLKELIEYYGHGLTTLADTSRIEVTRLLYENDKAGKKIYLNQDSIDSNFELKNYDYVNIDSFSGLLPYITVEGAVFVQKETVDNNPSTANKIVTTFYNDENYAFFLRRNKTWFNSESDIENSYIIREGNIITLNIQELIYNKDRYSDLTVQNGDRLIVPFKQYFVTVAGAVMKPGRFPYIPDRDLNYYIALAGGFNPDRSSRGAVTMVDINGDKMKKNDPILPETSITAQTDSFLYYFSKYAPVITTVLSIISTTLTIYIYAERI